ncbi:hypothetical protein K3495_g12312 [Podosphaera aphanis]|nr:hypothetical protein K3495_g12312 [Podosphaera aphanis]
MAGMELGATVGGQPETERLAAQRKEVEIDSIAAIRKIEVVLETMKIRVNPGGIASTKFGREILEALELFKVHKRLWMDASPKNPNNSTIEDRMLALEEAVRKSILTPARAQANSTASKSHATVAAPAASQSAVRIRIPGAEEMQPSQLLNMAKEHITGAYAVRKMRSNDTEVFVGSTAQRDAALNMPHPETFKILRQDYPVEISGVPLGTKVQGGKNADNKAIIKEIIQASKRIARLEINRIRWLHDGKEISKAKSSGKTRGTLIVSLPTEALQKEVVRNVIVIDSILYTAQLWSPRAQVKQCFNCSQWGHTQAACGKAARCGECASDHQSRDCPKKRISCCNCGKSHPSWHKSACQTYSVYRKSVERVRDEILERTNEIRREPSGILPAAIAIPDDELGYTIVQSKKAASSKRGPGRPRKISTPLAPASTITIDSRPPALSTRSKSPEEASSAATISKPPPRCS